MRDWWGADPLPAAPMCPILTAYPEPALRDIPAKYRDGTGYVLTDAAWANVGHNIAVLRETLERHLKQVETVNAAYAVSAPTEATK